MHFSFPLLFPTLRSGPSGISACGGLDSTGRGEISARARVGEWGAQTISHPSLSPFQKDLGGSFSFSQQGPSKETASLSGRKASAELIESVLLQSQPSAVTSTSDSEDVTSAQHRRGWGRDQPEVPGHGLRQREAWL